MKENMTNFVYFSSVFQLVIVDTGCKKAFTFILNSCWDKFDSLLAFKFIAGYFVYRKDQDQPKEYLFTFTVNQTKWLGTDVGTIFFVHSEWIEMGPLKVK